MAYGFQFSQFSIVLSYGFAATWAQVLSSTSGISSAEFHFRDRPMQAVNGKGVPTSQRLVVFLGGVAGI